MFELGHEILIGSFLTDSAFTGSSGFLSERVIDEECGQIDKIDVAYVIDEDGHRDNLSLLNYWESGAPRAAVGIRVLGLTRDTIGLNYNWFVPKRDRILIGVPESCGPRRPPPSTERFRSLGSGLAWPEGDANNYYVMAHPEFDYDAWFLNADMTSLGWLSKCGQKIDCESLPPIICFHAPNAETEQSFGPYEIGPRGVINFTIAVIGGDSVHVDPTAYRDIWDSDNPQPFIDQLDFSRLAENARSADWVYDNPGVDSDGDGFFW